ncbi:MAG: site-2 protease family protein [Myxococcota bacterium]
MTPCARCGAPLGDEALDCPSCRALVHADVLRDLAARAEAAEAAGDVSEALASWRRALELLPAGTVQAGRLRDRVVALSQQLDGAASPAPERGRGPWVWLAGLGTAAVAALSKGKLLLVGLTKLPTLLSMFVTVGVYASLFGWKLAAGFVVSIYVHEMGHVVALRRYGIAATAPMFVPGLGAFIRLKQYPATVLEDATTGLAGPLWGFGAALVAVGLWLATGDPLWAALARLGAWVNLFNLLPVWQLDGGRGWRALDRSHRWIAVVALGGGWLLSGDVLLLVIGLVGAVRAATSPAPAAGSDGILARYVGLVLALAGLLAWLPDPLTPGGT